LKSHNIVLFTPFLSPFALVTRYKLRIVSFSGGSSNRLFLVIVFVTDYIVVFATQEKPCASSQPHCSEVGLLAQYKPKVRPRVKKQETPLKFIFQEFLFVARVPGHE